MTWYTGIGFLALSMTFGFSGYLLPWNELAFFATRVGTGMAGAMPVVGDYLMLIMRGGEEVTGATIGRFFGLHVAILPLLTTGLLALHMLFIQRQGMSEPMNWVEKKPEDKKFMKFFPNFIYRDALVWLIVLNILALLAVIFPDGIGVVHWPLGEKADPFAAPPGVSSLAAVCGVCHALEAELFAMSPHADAFLENDFPMCETCHSNHDIIKPIEHMIGTTESAL